MKFRLIVTTAAALALAGAGSAHASPVSAPRVSSAVQGVQVPFMLVNVLQQTPTPQPSGGDVKIDVDLDDDGTVWYTDPFWIVIGVAAVIVIVALVAMASRGGSGGGTTVVR